MKCMGLCINWLSSGLIAGIRIAKMEHTVENFHGCYLLKCENPRFRGRTYIGYTVDPNRRQKQHNRGRKHGGAVRTSRKGPWSAVVIVYGFMSMISALQFEWTWQNPEDSRRLRHVKTKSHKENALSYRLRILAEMLCVSPWSRMPLTIQWLRSDYEIEFPVNLQPPEHMAILNGAVKTRKLNVQTSDRRDEMMEDNLQITENNSPVCCLCNHMLPDSKTSSDSFNQFASIIPLKAKKQQVPENPYITCLFTSCATKFHIRCIAEEFLKNDKDSLIPLKGECPVCKNNLLWADLIRFKKGFYRNCIVEPQGIQNLTGESDDEEM